MRGLFKRQLVRGSDYRRFTGFGGPICGAILLATTLLSPLNGYGQGLLGDPSSTLGGWGKFKLEAGAGFIDNPNIKIDNKHYSVTDPNGISHSLVATETSESIKTEQRFLAATMGMGRALDLFIKVGKFKTQDPFDGEFKPSGGLGFRFSPPQTGFLNFGFQMQAFYGTSENNGYDTSVDILTQTDPKGVHYQITGDGTAKDQLRLISYDMVLGVGVQNIQYVRPYAGLLVSFQNRTEKGSFSGQGDFITCHPTCNASPGTKPITLSWNTDVATDSLIGGVFGLTITPVDWAGMILEGNWAGGSLGHQSGLMASAFVKF
jgi:hypothetical protein